MVNREYESIAREFIQTIKALISNENALENLECYLSIHFQTWLDKWANTPPRTLQANFSAFQK